MTNPIFASLGATLTLIIAPLAADLSFVVEEMEKENPDIFGAAGAYGQAFALFNSSMALSTIVGPISCGFIVTRFGWGVATWTLAAFSASTALPVVCSQCFSFTTNDKRHAVEKGRFAYASADTDNGL